MLEKSKGHMEGEAESLHVDLRDMTNAHQESEKRRKNAEAQLSEAQARVTEDTAKLQELNAQNDRMKVSS